MRKIDLIYIDLKYLSKIILSNTSIYRNVIFKQFILKSLVEYVRRPQRFKLMLMGYMFYHLDDFGSINLMVILAE